MRPLFTFITAAAFLLHFTLGCCAHHAHAAEDAVCSGHGIVADHDHQGHDHDSHEPCEQSPGDRECPGEHCNDGHCVFMADGKSVEVQDSVTAVLPLFVAEPASITPISRIAAAAIDSGGLIALPVRTHLFHQILLI